jgi:hypothetical protein
MNKEKSNRASRKASRQNSTIENQVTALAAQADANGELPFTVTLKLHLWELFGLAQMARAKKKTMAGVFADYFDGDLARDLRGELMNNY